MTWGGAAAAVALLGAAASDATAVSSDGRWETTLDRHDLRVGEAAVLTAGVASRGRPGCPILAGVVLDMPQHGHGTDYQPSVEPLGSCTWRLGNVVPTMRGVWRLRLVLNDGDETSVADYEVIAQ